MAKLISKTYGEALFELAVEENKIDSFVEEIKTVREALAQNPEFDELFHHPKITKEEKTELVENVFKGRISDELTGFFKLLVEKDRYKEKEGILTFFLDKVKEVKGIGVAYVTTAIPLKDVQKKQVEEKLLATTQYKQMEMHYTEDASLIGGMVIRIGDRVVDSSISTKLSDLQRQLLKIQLG
ncbi:MAG: ATP synthase F1 subunit delta [Lachnospiraceae bacterium]|nr:ATP synthase F1 subunit delta [Lachnospiraceae bacterium]